MEAVEHRKILHSVPLGYAHHQSIYDENGHPIDYVFLEVNDVFEKITGLESKKIIGQKISDVLPELLKSKFDWITYYGNLAKNLVSTEFEQFSEPLNKWFKIYVSSLQYGYFTTLFTEITERKNAFHELNRMKNLFTILLELSQDISEFSTHELIEKTLDFAEEQTDSTIAFYHFVEDDQSTISLQTWSTNTLQNMCKAVGKGMHYPVEKAGIWAQCIRTRETIVVNDYKNYHIHYGLPEGHAPVNRFISMPVIRYDKIVAVLGVGNKEKDYTKEDVDVLKEISETLWNLISQKRLEDKANEARKKLKLILDNFSSFIYITDMDNYDILFMNEYGQNKFGRNLLGEKCHKLLYSSDKPCEFCSNKKILKMQESNNQDKLLQINELLINKKIYYNYEVYHQKEKCWYEIRDSIIQWFDGRLVKLSISTDITQRKEAENSLKEIAEHLQLLNDTKDKFFSIISHDLKNPLGSFKQVASILYDDYYTFSDEDRLEFLEALKDSSSNVYNLLENLLEWSRSQRGLIKFEAIETNLYELVKKSIDLATQTAENKNIKINNYIPIDLTYKVDLNLINTVIRNLISNSIKFSLSGSSIDIGYLPKENLTLYVRDYGVGMDDEKIKNLFRIDKSSSTLGTAREKGTGIGLILCKEFVEAHNGILRVESKVNEGTTFYIELDE